MWFLHGAEKLVWLPYSIYSLNTHSGRAFNDTPAARAAFRTRWGIPQDAVVFTNLARTFKTDQPWIDAAVEVLEIACCRLMVGIFCGGAGFRWFY